MTIPLFSSILKFFNDAIEEGRQFKQFKSDVKQLIETIATQDLAAFETQYAPLKDKIESRSYFHDQVLNAAIKADNVDMFKQILGELTPNHKVTSSAHFSIEGPSYYSEEPLISIAIDAKSQNVALYLATLPGIDPEAAGKKTKIYYNAHSPQTIITPYETPIAKALQQGMPAVAEQLALRKAEQATAQAANYRQQATATR